VTHFAFHGQLLVVIERRWKAIIVHGGVKVYRGAPAAARTYVEADRSRADDYYLAEGTGIAQHLTVDAEGRVVDAVPLSGNGYEAWVAGLDPDTGEPRGRLRADGHAVRFVEVVVNGPKSWSLAGELHPDVAAAYEAAQDQAARAIVSWLGQHATTRVGPRGGQVAVPVERLDAAVIRHYTSRAGDPHRHLHLQVSARVFAAGKWRGLDTVAFRDSIAAINGIGHAAVACDPGFRTALAAHGYTLTPEGEIAQLARYVGPFSKRAAQITGLLDRYEAEWRGQHPGVEPGPRLRRAWDARAWAQDRPDKVVPRDGREVNARWLDELRQLGYRDVDRPVQLALSLPGAIDRDAAAVEVIARLGAARSGWNAADVRGQVEQLLARENLIADPAARTELAEDLTDRALGLCVPLRESTPEHVRALTSRHVLDVEADLVARLAGRGAAAPGVGAPVTLEGLDAGQRRAVAALTGDASLVVIEGAAGVGKTTMLAAVRDTLDGQGRRMVVVTPTRNAAQVAAREIGARTGSAAWLAYEHGWRWHQTGTWTRLAAGDTDPVTGHPYAGPGEQARLRARDLLVVDEAGMCDQDTAAALLAVADETGARLALVGDRHQLPAVGRGGVLDLAARWTHPEARVDLTDVHRFVQTVDGTTVPDEHYAALSLAMRTGEDPGAVFDALHARGLIRLHASEADRTAALAKQIAAARAHGGSPAVVVDTREQAATLNAAIRDRLLTAGTVDDTHTGSARDGQRVGAGDTVVTRRNGTALAVANRETWTVTHVHSDLRLTVHAPDRGTRELPAGYVRDHVELGYATTGYGAQGATTEVAHLVLGEHTTAASAYVAMTRGRHANTAHLIAADLDDARDQWITAFARDRADHGPTHAARLAAAEAAGYAIARPLEAVLGELRHAWSIEQDCRDRLEQDIARRDLLAQIVPLRHAVDHDVPPLRAAWDRAADTARQARDQAEAAERTLTTATYTTREALLAAWDRQRPAAGQAAQTVRDRPGRLGQRRKTVARARDQVTAWAEHWRPLVPDLPTDIPGLLDRLCWFEDRPRIWGQLDQAARAQADAEHPDARAALHAAETTAESARRAWQDYRDTDQHYQHALAHFGNLAHTEHPDRRLADLTSTIPAIAGRLRDARGQVAALLAEPALRALPPEKISTEREGWQADRAAREHAQQAASALRAERAAAALRAEHARRAPVTPYHSPAPQHGHGISR
jgi:hypothetical protein